MLDRRRFTFGSLLLVGTAPVAARASGYQQKQAAQQAGPQQDEQQVLEEAAPPPLAVGFAVREAGGKLHVEVLVRNEGNRSLDVMVGRGSRPGAYIEVSLDGQELTQLVEVDRRDLISRIGPMPRYLTLARQAEHRIGPYVYGLPKGHTAASSNTLTFHCTVVTDQGEVRVGPHAVSWASDKRS